MHVCVCEEKLSVVALCVSVYLSVCFSLHREENVWLPLEGFST